MTAPAITRRIEGKLHRPHDDQGNHPDGIPISVIVYDHRVA